MTTRVPDSEAVLRAALHASWRRGKWVARRRLWWRWALWGLARFGPPVGLALAAIGAWVLWTQPASPPRPAEPLGQRAPERTAVHPGDAKPGDTADTPSPTAADPQAAGPASAPTAMATDGAPAATPPPAVALRLDTMMTPAVKPPAPKATRTTPPGEPPR